MKNNIVKNKKNEITKSKNSIINENVVFDLVPIDNQCSLAKCKKILLADISGIGASSMPVIDTIKNFKNIGKSGIYKVETGGGTLFNCKTTEGFRGGVQFVDKSIGQSVLKPVVLNPAILGIAIVLHLISSKIDGLNEKCDKILLEFKIDKESKLMGGFSILKEILDNYKHYYSKQLDLIEDLKKKLITADNDIIPLYNSCKLKLDDLISAGDYDFKEIQYNYILYSQSIELVAFSKFLKIILYQLYNKEDLEFEIDDINKYIDEYKKIQEKVFKLSDNEKKKIHYKIDTIKKNFYEFDKKLKIPFPGFKKLREGDAERINSLNRFDINFLDFYKSYVPAKVYVNSIKKIDNIFNTNVNMYLDETNLYIESSKEE